MRSFQQTLLFLVALFTFSAYAQSSASQSYEETVYITSTIYRVNTVTATGTPPVGGPVNSTLTIAPSAPTAYATGNPSASVSYSAGNATSPKPTGASNPPANFQGSAAGLSASGPVVAMLAAGLGLLAL